MSEVQKETAPAPRGAVIAAEGLTKRYGKASAVDNINFEIRKGEVFGLLGPNGAGKTTFIKMLCGLLAPTEGGAVVAGYDVRRAGAGLRGHVGYMAQRFSLYRHQTVLENLRLSAGLYGIHHRERGRRIDAVLSSLGLEALADRQPLAAPPGR